MSVTAQLLKSLHDDNSYSHDYELQKGSSRNTNSEDDSAHCLALLNRAPVPLNATADAQHLSHFTCSFRSC